MRGALRRDRCAAVKTFSAGVDPVPVGILTFALVQSHVGDNVLFTLVFVVRMRLSPLLCTSTSTYVHALDRQSEVLPGTFFGAHPSANREALDYQHPVGQALSVNEYVRETHIRRSSCSLCLPACLKTRWYEQLLFRMERLQFILHPHSPRQHASLQLVGNPASVIRLVSSSRSFDALDTRSAMPFEVWRCGLVRS